MPDVFCEYYYLVIAPEFWRFGGDFATDPDLTRWWRLLCG